MKGSDHREQERRVRKQKEAQEALRLDAKHRKSQPQSLEIKKRDTGLSTRGSSSEQEQAYLNKKQTI